MTISVGPAIGVDPGLAGDQLLSRRLRRCCQGHTMRSTRGTTGSPGSVGESGGSLARRLFGRRLGSRRARRRCRGLLGAGVRAGRRKCSARLPTCAGITFISRVDGRVIAACSGRVGSHGIERAHDLAVAAAAAVRIRHHLSRAATGAGRSRGCSRRRCAIASSRNSGVRDPATGMRTLRYAFGSASEFPGEVEQCGVPARPHVRRESALPSRSAWLPSRRWALRDGQARGALLKSSIRIIEIGDLVQRVFDDALAPPASLKPRDDRSARWFRRGWCSKREPARPR